MTCVFSYLCPESKANGKCGTPGGWGWGMGDGIGCVPRQILIPFIGCSRSFMSRFAIRCHIRAVLHARSQNTAVGDRQLRHIHLLILLSEWNGLAPTGLIFMKF